MTNLRAIGGSSIPSITHEQLVERHPAHAATAAHPEARVEAAQLVRASLDERRVTRLGRLGALGEHPLAPGARLDHEVTGRGDRAVGPEEREVVQGGWLGADRRGAQGLAPGADGVDLVDEHDALAPPLLGQLARLVGQELDGDRIHPDEHPGEARSGDRHERAVEVGGDRLGDHRLAGAGSAQEQQTALALAAGLLELLAGLPQGDHAGDLLLGLGLSADVCDLHAPARVARLVAADLAHREEQERPEEDREVDEEQQRQLDEHEPELGESVGREDLAQPLERVQERRADAREGEEHLAQGQQRDDDQQVDRQPPELRAPVPVAPPRDDVVGLEALVGAVQAGRWNQLAGQHLDQAAEHHHRDHGDDQRPDQPDVVRVKQDQEERRRCEQRRDRGPAGQPLPFVGQRRGVLVDRPPCGRGSFLGVRHRPEQESTGRRMRGAELRS